MMSRPHGRVSTRWGAELRNMRVEFAEMRKGLEALEEMEQARAVSAHPRPRLALVHAAEDPAGPTAIS